MQVEEKPWVDTLHEWVTTVDHKRLGILYIVYALVFLVLGGVEALIIRIQLIHSQNDFVSPQVFNRMFTMHGTTMIFFVAMPILFEFANYLVPLMIGARDMAFPRLNAFSFWLSAFGGLLLYFSFLGGSGLYGAGNAPDVGWWSYAPLGARAFSPGHSSDYWTLSLLVSGFGSIGTGINILATILCLRCPGMMLNRMPLLVWLNLVMAGMVLIAITPLSAAQIMLLIDRYLGGHFFDVQAGGSPIFFTICLLSSSLTIHYAGKFLEKREHGAFLSLWSLTILLGGLFLLGTGREWHRLIYEHGLTISTNLFGTTYYSLVGLHAFHVSAGIIMLVIVAILAFAGRVGREHFARVEVLSWYWHLRRNCPTSFAGLGGSISMASEPTRRAFDLPVAKRSRFSGSKIWSDSRALTKPELTF
jgi:hypothetical protein